MIFNQKHLVPENNIMDWKFRRLSLNLSVFCSLFVNVSYNAVEHNKSNSLHEPVFNPVLWTWIFYIGQHRNFIVNSPSRYIVIHPFRLKMKEKLYSDVFAQMQLTIRTLEYESEFLIFFFLECYPFWNSPIHFHKSFNLHEYQKYHLWPLRIDLVN